MSASPTPAQVADKVSRFVPEAETLAQLLYDMNVSLAVDLQRMKLLAEVDETTVSGAIDVLKIVDTRFHDDEAFREDLIGAIGTIGTYLTDAPRYNADLKTTTAERLHVAVAKTGLLIRHHYEAGDVRTPMLTFMPVPDKAVQPNAHLLMRLVADRFAAEPDFARDMTRVLVDAGRSQHQS